MKGRALCVAVLVAATAFGGASAARLSAAFPVVSSRSLCPTPPATSAGPSPASQIAYDTSLQDAAAAGMLGLTGKGGVSGDQVAVDLNWQPLPRPVVVTARIEFVGSAPGVVPDPYRIERLIEDRLPPQRAPNGTEVRFDVQVKARAPGSPPTPGYHQIFIVDDPLQNPFATHGTPNDRGKPETGCWPLQYKQNDMGTLYAHEMLHLFGLEDQADAVVFIRGRRVVANGVRPGDLGALRTWLRGHGYPDPTRGYSDWAEATRAGIATRQPRPGHENDIMQGAGAPRSAKVSPEDLARFVAIAGASVKAKPGDVLVNKNAANQNFGVGAHFDLYAPKNGKGHADGLVVYCLDFNKTFPTRADRFDVLGPAGALALPGMPQLQALLEVVARAQPGPLLLTYGAQEAVWKITENQDVDTPEGAALLAAAGIPAGAQFTDTPHFSDPNSGSANTGAVTTTGVLPRIPAAPAPKAPKPLLSDSILMPGVLPANRRLSVRLLLELTWAPDRIAIAIQRGRRTLMRSAGRKVPLGKSVLKIRLPKLAAGSFSLRLSGGFGTQTIGFNVVAKRRAAGSRK